MSKLLLTTDLSLCVEMDKAYYYCKSYCICDLHREGPHRDLSDLTAQWNTGVDLLEEAVEPVYGEGFNKLRKLV